MIGFEDDEALVFADLDDEVLDEKEEQALDKVFSCPEEKEQAQAHSNEELVYKIKAGDKTQYAELWAQIERFVYSRASVFYLQTKNRADALGYTVEDLVQEAFFALMKSVEAYPFDCENKFITYFSKHLKNAFFDLARLRSKGANANANIYITGKSLDAPIDNDENALSEIIEDECAQADFDAILEMSEHEEKQKDLRVAVSDLQEQERAIIEEHYYKGQTLTAIAKEKKLSVSLCESRRQNALRKLRQHSRIKKYEEFYQRKSELISRYSKGRSFKSWRESQCSTQDAYMLALEDLEEKYQLRR